MSSFTHLREAIKTKSNAIVNKVTFLKPKLASTLGGSFDLSLSAEIDSAIKIILDESFLKVIDRAIFALDSTINKTSQEVQSLAQKIFDNLFELETRVNTLINNFFQNLTGLLNNIKANLIDPIVASILKLEEKIFEDINQVIDKIFNFFTGTVKEFKDDLLRLFNPLPNPLDPCRQKFELGLTPTFQLTHTDIFNLFECNQLRRLNDGKTNVKEIQEIYAVLQLESFKMTCLGRGSPSFQELYMRKWLKYGQLFEIWKEFNENMTPQEAFDEAIRRLNIARDEYNAKIAEIDRVQAIANDAVNKAANAQNTANSALDIANQVNAKTQKISLDGNNLIIDAGPNFLAIQSDGNIVVYKDNGQPLFDTKTY